MADGVPYPLHPPFLWLHKRTKASGYRFKWPLANVILNLTFHLGAYIPRTVANNILAFRQEKLCLYNCIENQAKNIRESAQPET